MNNPSTGGKASGPMALRIPLPQQAPAAKASARQASSRMNRPTRRSLAKWWPVLLLLITGIVVYCLYRIPRSGFSTPLSVPFQLSGNFGELRSNHFHMGLDIRTNGEENLSVYAVATGYVSRILIEEYGLGKAVFITHPNGTTTVYAHLNRFYPALETAITTAQLKAQQREQDLRFTATDFPVRQGQFIALSGNTGGSEAPHLHFELRNTRNGNNLNPLLHGYKMADDQPPVLKGLYWYNRQYSTYRMAGNSITLSGNAGSYKAVKPVIKVRSPFISLGIRAEDKSNDNRFRFGIYRIELRMDDSLVHQAELDDFSNADSRYINATVDYTRWIRTGIYVQHLSLLPGNHFPAIKGPGILDLSDGQVHTIKIRLYDADNNSSTFENKVQYSGAVEVPPALVPGSFKLVPGRANRVNGKQCAVTFTKAAFYDTVFFELKEQANTGAGKASALVSLHNGTVPVHDAYQVTLKASPWMNDRLRKKTVMQLNSGKKKYTARGTWHNNWCTASFNVLGNVQLLIDTLPPVVQWKKEQGGQSVTSENNKLNLLCTDETDGVASFRAELNGQWLLYDRKGNEFTVTVPADCKPGKHQLAITIADVAGNTTRQVVNFIKD